MDKYLYLTINLASISGPFLASFYPKHAFYKSWASFFKANSIVALFFILWDILFTHLGVWGFNSRYLLGINFFNIPLEEFMFFFFIPYASVFVYFSLNYLVKNNPLDKYHRSVTLFFAAALVLIAAFYSERLYTSITFLLTSGYLFFNYVNKISLSRIYFSYSVVFFFFLIVNGILTGSFIEEPVVWYDNNENLGIRIGTIPVEDVFYGFLLVGSIIQLFEFFNSENKKMTNPDC